MQRIENEAFRGCASLISITCEGETPATLGNNALALVGFISRLWIYVPAGKEKAYKTAWPEFKNCIFDPRLACQVDETKYATVQDAIDAITTAGVAGKTIQMIDDAELTDALQVYTNSPAFTLDLNGYVIKQTGAGKAVIINGKNLTITDSNPTAVHYFTVGNDGCWTLNTTATTGTAFENLTTIPADGTVVALKGGCLTGGSNTNGGGAIYNGGTMTLSGGNIVGNKSTSLGGGIGNADNTTFTMTGGNVCGNITSGNNLQAGGIYVGQGVQFTMSGGCVSYNSSTNGGAIQNLGQTTITGGKIWGNDAGGSGGAILTGASTELGVTLNISGTASFMYNHGTDFGGVISAIQAYGAITMTGGTISNNKCDWGAVVILSKNHKLTVGGTAVIYGNTKDDGTTPTNITHCNDGENQNLISISSATPLATGAKFGILMIAPSSFTIAGNASESDLQYFYADDESAIPTYRNGSLELQIVLDEATVTQQKLAHINDYYGSVGTTVKIGRTFYKDGGYNTLCLPFSLTAEALAASPLAGYTKLQEFSSATVVNAGEVNETLVLTLSDVTAIEAGKPYIITWASGENLVNPIFDGVAITATAGTTSSTVNNVTFCGTLVPYAVEANDLGVLFVGNGGNLHWPNAGGNIKAMRGYFTVNLGGNNAPARGARAIFGDAEDATAISTVTAQQNTARVQKLIKNGRVVIISNGQRYNMNGQIIK